MTSRRLHLSTTPGEQPPRWARGTHLREGTFSKRGAPPGGRVPRTRPFPGPVHTLWLWQGRPQVACRPPAQEAGVRSAGGGHEDVKNEIKDLARPQNCLRVPCASRPRILVCLPLTPPGSQSAESRRSWDDGPGAHASRRSHTGAEAAGVSAALSPSLLPQDTAAETRQEPEAHMPPACQRAGSRSLVLAQLPGLQGDSHARCAASAGGQRQEAGAGGRRYAPQSPRRLSAPQAHARGSGLGARGTG